MTKREAVKLILGVEEDDFGKLKEPPKWDEVCEFAITQISTRTPVYQAIEAEIAEQEKLSGPLQIHMEAVGKGDPRAIVMFCMNVLRESAASVSNPAKFVSSILRCCVVMIYAFMWGQAWRMRLATVQKVQGFNRLISPFQQEGDEPKGA